jgi:two-component system, OmpR family, KDP operon response regulator KdpE
MVFDGVRSDEVLTLVRSTVADAVLLDAAAWSSDCVESCTALRRTAPGLPILWLSDRDSEESKLKAFAAGVDDYITKPLHPRELIARLRAVMRRSAASISGGSQLQESASSELIIGDLLIDDMQRLVKKAGRPIHLTPKQFDMLHFLMKNSGKAISHVKLLRSVWGPAYGDELEYLRTYVRQLRLKIEDEPAKPRYLLTEPHFGYRFVAPDSFPVR